MSRNNIQALKTVDGETLMSKPLQPLNFIVDTLLSQGLHILAGSPKVGKSWLALWLAVTVAKGDAIWGMPVKQGSWLQASTASRRSATRNSSARNFSMASVMVKCIFILCSLSTRMKT